MRQAHTTTTTPSNVQHLHEDAWIKEQELIASRVRIPRDDFYAAAGQKLNERYTVVQSKLLSLGPLSVGNQHSERDPLLFGGLDITYDPNDDSSAVAVYVVLNEKLDLVYHDVEYCTITVPYIPSFLSFRELPPLLRLVEKQRHEQPQYTPSVLFVDGNGMWHPRRAGVACFVGVRTGLPTIGVSKNLYVTAGLTKEQVHAGIEKSIDEAWQCSMDQPPPSATLATHVLFDSRPIDCTASQDVAADDTVMHQASDRKRKLSKLGPHCIGLAVPMACERNGALSIDAMCLVGHGRGESTSAGVTQPIYISVGAHISLCDAVVLSATLAKYRIPEPIRRADLMGRELLRQPS